MKKIILFILYNLLVGVMVVKGLSLQSKTTKVKGSRSIQVTGTLLNKDKTPANGVKLIIGPLKKNGVQMLFENIGTPGTTNDLALVNPEGKTNPKGHFTVQMKIKNNFISSFQNTDLGICASSQQVVDVSKCALRANGDFIKFSIDSNTKKVDLGEIIID